MKKLTGLDKKLVPLFDEDLKANIDGMPTFRHCFKMALGQGQPKTADESRRAIRIIAKLRGEADVELHEEDLKLIVDRVAMNQPGFITSIHGQLLEKLDSIKK